MKFSLSVSRSKEMGDHTRQRKNVLPWWESNPRPLGSIASYRSGNEPTLTRMIARKSSLTTLRFDQPLLYRLSHELSVSRHNKIGFNFFCLFLLLDSEKKKLVLSNHCKPRLFPKITPPPPPLNKLPQQLFLLFHA